MSLLFPEKISFEFQSSIENDPRGVLKEVVEYLNSQEEEYEHLVAINEYLKDDNTDSFYFQPIQ